MMNECLQIYCVELCNATKLLTFNKCMLTSYSLASLWYEEHSTREMDHNEYHGSRTGAFGFPSNLGSSMLDSYCQGLLLISSCVIEWATVIAPQSYASGTSGVCSSSVLTIPRGSFFCEDLCRLGFLFVPHLIATHTLVSSHSLPT